MARSKQRIFVITKKDDPNFVKVVGSEQDALQVTGPEYDEKGYVISGFEKQQETYYAPVSLESGEE